MNPAVKLALLYVRDLLEFDEQSMTPGRINEEQVDFATNYIAIDSLSDSRALSSGNKFDGDAETMTLAKNYRETVTISFYGKDAYEISDDFIMLSGSEKATQLQESLGFTAYTSPSTIDVKMLTGQQYRNRLDVSVVCVYNKTKNISTLRIDTQQVSVITNN